MSSDTAFHDLSDRGGASPPTGARNRAPRPIVGDDRAAVHDLVSRLGRWLDDKGYGDPDETAAILSPDATVVTPGGEASGHSAIAAQARRGHDAYRTHHQITNVLAHAVGTPPAQSATAAPDRAVVRANLQVVFAPAPTAEAPIGEPLFILGEVYALEAERTPGGWRLARVEIRPVWKIGERPPVAA